MKINIYSVFDVKSQLYGTPFFMLRDEIAQRAFADLVNDKSTMVSRHPEDFLLYKIGEFWDDSGNVSSTIPPLALGNASGYKRQQVPLQLPGLVGSEVEAVVKNGIEEVVK